MDLEFQDVGFILFENDTVPAGPIATTKVMGASPANASAVPHQMILLLPGSGFCGASIIHPLLLLTAAHCFSEAGLDPKSIRVATAAEIEHGFLYGKSLNVSSIIVHPKYNRSSFMDNDIALVTLETWIQFDNNATKPIRIPKEDPKLIPPGTAIVSGYGGTISSLARQTRLLSAKVPLVDRETCRSSWKAKGLVLTDSMICAGNNEKDACGGDSGGPLTCKDSGGEEFLCGIVSYGTRCSFRHRINSNPGIYTDVRKYHGWIRKYMQIWWRYYLNLRRGEPLEDLDGNKSCGKDSFECKGIKRCVPESFKCDGEIDCAPWDTSDETNCTKITCAKGRFRCKTGKRCVPLAFCNDGDNDCGDGSDESADCRPVLAG